MSPDKKIKPKRALIVILGLFLGLIFGILIAFIRNIMNKTKTDTI
ncbi:GNVR domain-containing protein [sulfur-oxidizing endosymbiont of Gigantopelta aegis]